MAAGALLRRLGDQRWRQQRDAAFLACEKLQVRVLFSGEAVHAPTLAADAVDLARFRLGVE